VKVISRETIKALRKDVTAKCYGDISVNVNYWKNRKKKKRMRQVGCRDSSRSFYGCFEIE
jgi:GTP-binding protein LepA